MVKIRPAFTMIELVMVIVVLGIVASIGADMIASLYTNYLRTRTLNYLETQTELTLEQIAKRLQYRIKDSVIVRQDDGTLLALSNSNVDDTFHILEWIGYSNESLLGVPLPGWSGFIDLNSTSTNKTAKTLSSPESNLTFASDTMNSLTEGKVDLNVTNHEAALIFKIPHNIADFGWGTTVNADGSAIIKVFRSNDTTFKISDDEDINNTIPDIYEHYYLSHSAYAIVPEGTAAQKEQADFNLTLYYNYQPWRGEYYKDANISSSTLAEHVSLFRFKQDQSVMHLKLCMHDANQTGIGDRIVVCKEKVVY